MHGYDFHVIVLCTQGEMFMVLLRVYIHAEQAVRHIFSLPGMDETKIYHCILFFY